MDIPLNYIIDIIYRRCNRPKYMSHQNVYNFECCICNEGKSKGRKRRGYFLVEDNYFCCKNCQQTWSVIEWIKKVTGLTYQEVMQESSGYNDSISDILQRSKSKEEKKSNPYTLPYDCINLTDDHQLEYFKDNKIVNDVISYATNRKLFTAVNRPKTLYTSLTDKLHRNRLIIPFFNDQGKIIFYQSRAVYDKDKEFARYLSKMDADFSVFGVDKIDPNLEFIFLFEGPIDAMFVKNGVGIGGLSLTQVQEKQLERYRFHQRIWVLDNQMDNKDVVKKYKDLIEQGQRVFITPPTFKEFKDLNEICVNFNLDQISPEFFIKNSSSGMNALLKLTT
jgi:hypothetical protein